MLSEQNTTDPPNPSPDPPRRRGLKGFLISAVLLLLIYGKELAELVRYSFGVDLHSHVPLIPMVSAYLIHQEKARWPLSCGSSPGMATLAALPGAVTLALRLGVTGLSQNDSLALGAFSFLCFLVAAGFFFLGRIWLQRLAFPVGFLIFMVPIPDAVAAGMERFLMTASAGGAETLYTVAGVPFVRAGQIFELPGINLEVARECSGIRSSWALFITSVLAAHMFLRSPLKRLTLVLAVLPLGILRNAFRVLVLGWLCVNRGPYMIHSDIHHRGGPIFFVLSLIPFALLLWGLRRMETKSSAGDEYPEKPALPKKFFFE
jgi:exosortase C (VPDSG-CTERM-specific)